MLYFIIFLTLFCVQNSKGIIEKKFIFVIQQEATIGPIQRDEFFEIQFYLDHILQPNGVVPGAVPALTRTQGSFGIAFLKLMLNEQLHKYTVCAQKFRRIKTHHGPTTYLTIVPIEQFFFEKNCVNVNTNHDYSLIHFVLGFLSNAFPGSNLNPMPPSLPPYTLTLDLQIDNKIDRTGRTYFFHLYCVGNERNNFYLEITEDKPSKQTTILDNICASNVYSVGLMVTQKTTHQTTYLIKEEIVFSVNCPKPNLTDEQREILYELAIFKNKQNQLKCLCLKPRQRNNVLTTNPIETAQAAIGAETSVKRDELNEANEQRPPVVHHNETLNLLDNFVGDYQPENEEESRSTADQLKTDKQTIAFL